MKKRGMELSINFLVMIILGIAFLSLSMTFIFKYFGQAEKMQIGISQSTKSELDKLMSGGNRLALPLNIKKGDLGDTFDFGLGILNMELEERTFCIEVGECQWIKSDGSIGKCSGEAPSQDYDIQYRPISKIKPNARDYLTIVIQPLKESSIVQPTTIVFKANVYSYITSENPNLVLQQDGKCPSAMDGTSKTELVYGTPQLIKITV